MHYERTNKQDEAFDLLATKATDIMLYGGSRSGKTFSFTEAVIARAVKCKSRHAILRQHFNHCKQTMWYDTIPKVMDIVYSGLEDRCTWSKADWYIKLPNKSEIWIGGLDDKERTDKILGNEYSSIYFVECSQMSEASVNIAKTRLAEKNTLMKKSYYCCNPPKRSHWLYRKFIDQVDEQGQKMKDWYMYKSLLMNPYDNIKNIDSEYISNILDKLPPLLRQRFRDGLWVSDETDIFKAEWLLPCEVEEKDIAAKFTFIDPANTSKEMASDNTCESAILTMGVTYSGHIFDIELLHGFWSYGELKAKAKYAYDMHSKCSNYTIGVEDVGSQKWLSTDLAEIGITCSLIRPINDKVTRAISVTDILEQGRVSVNDNFLRKQLLGFPGDKLKDAVDCFVYCLKMVKEMNLTYERSVDKYKALDGASRLFWENYDKEHEPPPNNSGEDWGL